MSASDAVTVLIVDDETDLRFLLRRLLEREDGLSVVGEAGNGQQALTRIEELRPDAVVLDLSMPVMDGLGVLSALDGRVDAPRVVVLSGFAGADVADRVLELGAVRYLEKGREGFRELVSVLRGGPPER